MGLATLRGAELGELLMGSSVEPEGGRGGGLKGVEKVCLGVREPRGAHGLQGWLGLKWPLSVALGSWALPTPLRQVRSTLRFIMA